MQASHEPTYLYAPIPLLLGNEYDNIFERSTRQSKISFSFNDNRNDAFYNQKLLLALYQVGASIINGGLTCLDKPADQAGMICEFSGATQLDDQQQAQRAAFLHYYSQLPKSRANGLVTENPLLALFLIKVALDHLSPSIITHIYRELVTRVPQVTTGSLRVVFPNGSSFFHENALTGIIGAYIANNRSRCGEALPINLGNPFLSGNPLLIGIASLEQLNKVMALDLSSFAANVNKYHCNDSALSQLKQTIAPLFNEYIAKKKAFFYSTHQNNDRASDTLAHINRSPYLWEIKQLLEQELSFFSPTPNFGLKAKKEDLEFVEAAKAYSPKEKSGYYRALTAAQDALEVYVLQLSRSRDALLK